MCGHSSVKSASGCGNGTGGTCAEDERSASRRHRGRDEWVLLRRKCIYTLRSLHPPSPSLSRILRSRFARFAPTLQPLSAMAPSGPGMLLRRIADAPSVTRLRPQDAKVEHASTLRCLSLSLFFSPCPRLFLPRPLLLHRSLSPDDLFRLIFHLPYLRRGDSSCDSLSLFFSRNR